MARKLIPGLVVLALAAVAAAPAALGWQAERTYARIVERVNAGNRDIAVRIDEYERGWLSARARYTVRITGPYHDAFREIVGSDRRLELDGRDRISHGPWADGRPAVARIDSEIRMTEALRALGQEAIADAPIISARSVIDLGGDVHARFHVPDHRFETAAGEAGGGALSAEWQEVSGDAGLVDGITRFTVLVRELTLQNDGGDRLAVSDLEIGERSRRGRDGLRLDRAHLTIGRLDLRLDDPQRPLDFRMRRLELAGEIDAAGDGDHAGIDSLLSFERALANGIELSDARVETRLAHLRREPLARLQALMSEMQGEPGPGDDLEARDVPDAQIRAAFAELLRGSPRLQSESLQVDTRDGRIAGDLHLAFDGERRFDIDVPMTLLGPLSGRLQLYLPRDLVRRALYTGMREQLPGGEPGADMDARLRRQADQAIDVLVGTRLLDEQDGRLVLRIDKEAGGPPLVNDQDIMRLLQAIAGLMQR